MLIYNYFGGFNWTKGESLFATLSFGNMGYSGNDCGMNFIDWSDSQTTVNLQC
jgi:hypothetical protein